MRTRRISKFAFLRLEDYGVANDMNFNLIYFSLSLSLPRRRLCVVTELPIHRNERIWELLCNTKSKLNYVSRRWAGEYR